MLFTELDFPEPELLLREEPDLGLTAPDPLRGLEPPELLPLPGLTCRVLSFRLEVPLLRPEFQTRVPLFLGFMGFRLLWVALPPERPSVLPSRTAPPVRLMLPPLRVVPLSPRTEVPPPPEPLATGTSEDRFPEPPARCRNSDPEPRAAVVRDRPLVLPPPRMRNPELPLTRTPPSRSGRERDVTLTPSPVRTPSFFASSG